jgi:hypothetical protein
LSIPDSHSCARLWVHLEAESHGIVIPVLYFSSHAIVHNDSRYVVITIKRESYQAAIAGVDFYCPTGYAAPMARFKLLFWYSAWEDLN